LIRLHGFRTFSPSQENGFVAAAKLFRQQGSMTHVFAIAIAGLDGVGRATAKNHRLGRDLRRPKFWNAQARPGRPALGGILHGRSGRADQACPAWLPSIVRAEDLARFSRVGAECARCRLFPGDRRPDRDIGLIRRWRPMTQRCPGQAPPQLLSRSLARRIDPPTPPRN